VFSREKKLTNNVMIKYLLKELTLYFSIAFLFFFIVFFCNQILLVAESILKQRVPLFQVIKLMTYSLPFIIAQSAPFATLVGFLMCIGRMMTDNEIMIFRASGLPYRYILIPVLALGLLISILSFGVNDYLLPLGTIKYTKLYREILTSTPSVALESNSVKRTNDFTLVIGNVTDRDVSDLLFFDTDEQGNQRVIASGKTKIVDTHDRSILMQLQMKNPAIANFNKKDRKTVDYIQSDEASMNVFVSDMDDSFSNSTSPREMTSYDVFKRIRAMKKDPGRYSKLLVNSYEVEYFKKFSLPFGSIFFALLAMHLAILFGKVNGQTIGLIIGVLLSVLYWAMMILGQTFGIRNGLNPFWTMWLPNILVGTAGLLFYLRLRRK
jgi:lipopolysaccharide export system permease protein